MAQETKTEKAAFAGGCFWCTESLFDHTPGVMSVVSGYTDGKNKNPTYEEVSSGTTGHAEAVEVVFDPAVVSYEALLDTFFKNIDPIAVNAQFADHGTQYRTAVFYHDESQKKAAEDYKRKLEASGKFNKPIATHIVPASEFYPAEDYHQEYYKKNATHYNRYKAASGRDQFKKKVWGE